MRLLIDSMILLMVLVILIGAVSYRHEAERKDLEMLSVREGLNRFQKTLEYQSALWMAQEDSQGNYPPQIMPEWFSKGLPRNSLIAGKRPWLDIAPQGDYNDHPPDPLATGEQAAFWYNPERGIIRARVPQQGTDRLTLELYNRVNGTALTKLLNDSDPQREPVAFNPHPVTSGQHASPDLRTIDLVEALEPPAVDTDQTDAPEAVTVEPIIPWWDKPKSKSKSKSGSEAAVQPDPVAEPAPARPSLLAPGGP